MTMYIIDNLIKKITGVSAQQFHLLKLIQINFNE